MENPNTIQFNPTDVPEELDGIRAVPTIDPSKTDECAMKTADEETKNIDEIEKNYVSRAELDELLRLARLEGRNSAIEEKLERDGAQTDQPTIGDDLLRALRKSVWE